MKPGLAILLVILGVGVIAMLPRWPYTADWGWIPSSGLGLILLAILALWFMGLVG